MADAPDTFHRIWGTIVDPGGDPEGIHRCATACRTLSGDLTTVLAVLDPVATGLQPHWRSKAGGGFQKAWAEFNPIMSHYAQQLHEAGDSLDKVADAIHEAQVQARNFLIMVGVTLVVGAALTFFTFGTSDAAAIVAVETEAGVVATMMARLGALLAGEAEAVSALLSAMQLTAARFALGMGLSAAATVGVKGILQGENVLDPANYTAKDATNILLGGVLTAGMGTIAGIGRASAVLDAHPIAGAGVAGIIGGGGGSTIGQVWLNHRSLLDLNTWADIALSAGIAAVSGVAIGSAAVGISKGVTAIGGTGEPLLEEPLLVADEPQLSGLLGPNGRPLTMAGDEIPAPAGPLLGVDGEPLPSTPSTVTTPSIRPNGQPLFPPQQFPRPGFRAVTGGDLVRGLTGLPAGGLQYLITFPHPTAPLAGPGLPPAGPTAPDFPIEHPLPPPISVPVRRGDSLWAIAEREYGDGSKWRLIAEANHIGRPYTIHVGQSLVIPPLPAPLPNPVQATSYVVHDGDSLWAIAQREYGDGSKFGLIAEANHLSPPYHVFHGQTLAIPAVPQPVG